LIKASIFAHTDRALRITTEFELDPIFLNLETAIPCGLLVNEVLMNALKHAFSDQQDGVISILLKENRLDDRLDNFSPSSSHQSLKRQPPPFQSSEAKIYAQNNSQFKRDGNQYHYILRICDDGIGFPESLDPETTESVGMSLIRDLTYQLGGQYQIIRQEQAQGTCFQLLFSPLNYRKRM
ncbi:MAG: sensor histidine kinase, partial [Okeania sp. SIO2H7]|nr:sensor histidine kinase [Okeania sp. SIO2H7]